MEIIQIIIFVGIIVAAGVQQLIKTTRKEEAARNEYPMPDFPTETEPAAETETPTPVRPRRAYTKPEAAPRKAQTETAPKAARPTAAPDRRIRLGNREEARRAFLYSEIFNRKY